MKRKKFFGRKKNWFNKKVNRWTGADMVHATGFVTLLTTMICGLPFVGILVKEKLD